MPNLYKRTPIYTMASRQTITRCTPNRLKQRNPFNSHNNLPSYVPYKLSLGMKLDWNLNVENCFLADAKRASKAFFRELIHETSC